MELSKGLFARRRRVFAFLITVTASLCLTTSASAATGTLLQAAGAAGCFDLNGGSGCTGSNAGYEALRWTQAVVVSPDGEFAYAAARGTQSVMVFERDTATGALTQKAGADGCVQDTSYYLLCPTANGLVNPVDLAISADGLNVYVVGEETIAVFDRNTTTGALTQKAGADGCWSSDAALYGAGLCRQATARLVNATAVAVTPDGAHVYVTDLDGVEFFNRNTTTGVLTAGSGRCLSAVGPCVVAHSVGGAQDIAISPDSTHAYIVNDVTDAVTATRIASSGRLVPLANQCTSHQDSFGVTTDPLCTSSSTASMDNPAGVAITPDGEHVYVTAKGTNSISEFSRETDSASANYGTLTQLSSGSGACISNAAIAGCDTVLTARSMANPEKIAATNESVYVVSSSAASYAIASFSREDDSTAAAFGQLTQLALADGGCIQDTSIGGGPCGKARGLLQPMNVALSPNEDFVYTTAYGAGGVAGQDGGSIGIFSRELPPVIPTDPGDPDPEEPVVPPADEPDPDEPPTDSPPADTVTTDGGTQDSTVAATSTATDSSSGSGSTATDTTPAETTSLATACAALTKAKKNWSVSQWAYLRGGTRARMRMRSGAHVAQTGKRATVKVEARGTYGRKSRVKKVTFSIDGVQQSVATSSPWQLVIKPSELSAGHHLASAKVTPKSGSSKTVTLKFTVGCEPARATATISSLLLRAHPDQGSRANSGETPLSSYVTTFPTAVRLSKTALKRKHGKTIGSLRLTDVDGNYTRFKLKAPSKVKSSVTLLNDSSGTGTKVTMTTGKGPKVSVTNLPDKITGVWVSLKGKQTRLFKNANVCAKLTYTMKMTDRTGSSLTFTQPRKLCSNVR